MAVPDLLALRRLTGTWRLPVAAAVLVGACTGPTAPIDDDLYVEVMSRLSVVEARIVDAARTDSARAAVLRETGVSAEDLLEYTRVFGGDVEKMAELWERIRVVSDSIEAAEAEALLHDTTGSGP